MTNENAQPKLGAAVNSEFASKSSSHRPQECHADLGLLDDDDTPDMRRAPAP